jgi:hypothetical protein
VKLFAALLAVIGALVVAAAARAGHEFPVYPSYYPHAITIEPMTSEVAAERLSGNKIQAYLGAAPAFGGKPPDSIVPVESLGSFVVIRVNSASPLARDAASTCAVARTVAREIAARGAGRLTMHPYPVTPFHGDYLYFADLADAARARVLGAAAPALPATAHVKVHAAGNLAQTLVPKQWIVQSADWDATIDEVDAAGLVMRAATPMNGWTGPPWLRTGWFQATLLLAPADGAAHERAEADRRRLEALDYASPVERVNLERELVSALTASCDAVVAGYTVKREWLSADYSAGVENIGYDAITGLESPIFIRTVKLKDFPWNGWLTLGIDAKPAAAWNPIAGFDDRFGRLLWSAVGDPALLPAPGDAGWMLNRISDVRAAAIRR